MVLYFINKLRKSRRTRTAGSSANGSLQVAILAEYAAIQIHNTRSEGWPLAASGRRPRRGTRVRCRWSPSRTCPPPRLGRACGGRLRTRCSSWGPRAPRSGSRCRAACWSRRCEPNTCARKSMPYTRRRHTAEGARPAGGRSHARATWLELQDDSFF